jgi:hypothetical protein
MKKIDLYKEQKEFYNPSAKELTVIDVPEFKFLMINGKGDPNTSKEYQNVVSALYTLSYTLKFMFKKGPEQTDYKVLPLEGLWWAEDMGDFLSGKKDNWLWTMMIRQPDLITEEHFKQALESVKKKKPDIDISDVRFEKFREGRSVQIMYIGPFSEEGPTIKNMHEFIAAQGKKPSGKHHEIYLSDVRRVDPSKWRTILRQPFNKFGDTNTGKGVWVSFPPVVTFKESNCSITLLGIVSISGIGIPNLFAFSQKEASRIPIFPIGPIHSYS